MASFFITGNSTVAQTLAAGDNGFVAASGTLYTETATAVTITGSSSLTVLGTVATAEATAAIRTSGTVETIDIIVGAQGSILSTTTDAVRLAVSGDLDLLNEGLIFGGKSLYLDGGGTGNATIRNEGRMIGNLEINDCSAFILHNTGLIEGSVWVQGSYARIENYGMVTSTLNLSAGSDFFRNSGGHVVGGVYGFGGDDFFSVDRSDIYISGGAGYDTMSSYVSIQIGSSVEELNLLGALGLMGLGRNGNEQINGGEGNDTIEGRLGNDILWGNSGNDLIYGGGGDDTFNLSEGDDSLFGGAGIDEANGYVIQDNLTINLATGLLEMRDELGEVLHSVSLSRFENASGGLNDDRVTGNLAANVLNGNSGNDSLFGGIGNDLLDGGVHNDLLVGGADADTLIGGQGADTMTGGGGADVFRFVSRYDAINPYIDRITDFSLAQDKLDFALIDADLATSGDQAFVFIGSAAFSGSGPQIRFAQNVGAVTTTVQVLLAGSVVTSIEIVLNGLHNLTADAFIL